MKKYKFTVIIEKDEDGKYIASVPALPGCHTQADNLNDLHLRVKEVIRLYIEVNELKEVRPETFVGIHQIEIDI